MLSFVEKGDFMNNTKEDPATKNIKGTRIIDLTVRKIERSVCIQDSITKEYNSIVKVEGVDGLLRGRSEMIIISKNMKCIFIAPDKTFLYRIPGGTWNKDEDHITAAIRETQEEAHINTRDVRYVGSYIEYRDYKYWNNNPKHKKIQLVGSYTEVYAGIQDSIYTKPVRAEDQDDIAWLGGFYKLEKVYSKLMPIHKQAVDLILNKGE